VQGSPQDTADQQAFAKQIRDALTAALGAKPVDESDPDIAGAIAANRNAGQRSLQQERDQIAERLNAQGLVGSGSLDQQMQAAQERTGTAQAQFAGNAVLNQALARRKQLTDLLTLGSNVMSSDQSRALQAKIADLDGFLRQQSITNQNNQFNDQLGLTAAQFQALMNRYALSAALGA
jgi:hypothetical protein